MNWARALGLALLPGLLWLVGCGPEPAPAGLNGTSWELTSLNGEGLAPSTTITLVFADGFVSGYGGCNAYGRLAAKDGAPGNRYRATEDGLLVIEELATGDINCPAPGGVVEQEVAYLKALGSAEAYRLQSDHLEIVDGSGQVVLEFSR